MDHNEIFLHRMYGFSKLHTPKINCGKYATQVVQNFYDANPISRASNPDHQPSHPCGMWQLWIGRESQATAKYVLLRYFLQLSLQYWSQGSLQYIIKSLNTFTSKTASYFLNSFELSLFKKTNAIK